MTSSASTTTIATPPEFRSNDVIPDHYLANVVIFFIIFIAIGAITVRVLKHKFPAAFFKANPKETQLVKHTQQLSTATRLHVVTYNQSTFLIVESTNHIAVQAVTVDKEQDASGQTIQLSQEASDGH
jgi:hypothetical protein